MPATSSTSLPESFQHKPKLILRLSSLTGHQWRRLSSYTCGTERFWEHVAVVLPVQYRHAGMLGKSQNRSLRRFLQVDGSVCTEKYRSDLQVPRWLTWEWLWIKTSLKWQRALDKWASQNMVTSWAMHMPAVRDISSHARPDLPIWALMKLPGIVQTFWSPMSPPCWR